MLYTDTDDAADKGLAGAYNSNVLKRYVQLLRDDDVAGIDNTTIAVGRKAAQFVARLKDTQVVGVYEDVPDRPTGPAFRAILDTAHDMFVSKQVDAVDVVFTRFYSSMTQHPDTIHLLPAGLDAEQLDAVDDDEAIPDDEALFEPSPQAVLDTIAARMVSARLYQALLDARASEHSQRSRAVSIQNPYNLLNRSYEVGLAEISLRENIGLLAYSPLAFGLLSGKYRTKPWQPEWRIARYSRFTRYTKPQGFAAVFAHFAARDVDFQQFQIGKQACAVGVDEHFVPIKIGVFHGVAFAIQIAALLGDGADAV